MFQMKASLTENQQALLANELLPWCAYEADTFYKIQKLHNKNVHTKNLNAGIKRNLNAEEHKEKNTNNFVTSPPVITTGTD